MRNETSRQRGLGMVEVLVAVAILAVAVVIALLLYDAARKSFKKGENVTEQQQAVRIAFDTLSSDLRMAGFNSNPDGDPNRPDEQIEAAYDTAIVIRADLDAEDPTASATPETALASGGGAFLSVSTGNDEIVTYVLAKPDGSSTDTLTFRADVKDSPRDGAVETVNIPNVALVQDDPPYTLYRVTLNNDVTQWGGANFLVRTPLVENVRSMTFRYFNQAGAQVNSTFNLASVADDIGGLDLPVPRTSRASVRRIQIELEGLTRDPDLGWVDPDDTDPDTRAYRKFELTGDITPRNLGKVGIRDLMADVVPPAQPGQPTVVPGHCGGLWISWPANQPEDQVVSYRINYGTASGVASGQRSISTTSYYLGGLTHGATYYVWIEALDAAGNVSPPSTESSATLTNVNTPTTPTNLVASSNLNGAVQLAWDRTLTNTAANPSGDPRAPLIRDLQGYRVYRGLNSGFSPVLTARIADETVVGNEATPSHPDTNVINCRPYYYRVTAVDACGTESASTPATAGSAYSTVVPEAPVNAQAFLAGLGASRVTWEAVDRDVEGHTITIDTYKVYRSNLVPRDVDPDSVTYQQIGTATGALEYVDSAAPTLIDGHMVFYKVSAIDDCFNESALSNAAAPTCAFAGSVRFATPSDGQPVAGVVPVQVVVSGGGSETYAKLEIQFYHETQRSVVHSVELEPPSPLPSAGQPWVWDYDWFANPPGPYTITATVVNDDGCSRSKSIHVAAGTDVGCCLSPPNPDLDPIILFCTGEGNPQVECKEVSYEIINNNCLTAVRVDEMTITWTNATANAPRLSGIKYDGSLVANFSPLAPGPSATKVFAPPQPSIGIERNSANPLAVSYLFDQVMSDKQGPNFRRNELTTTYSYTLLDSAGDPTQITGQCGPGASAGSIFDNMIVQQHN